MPVYSITTPSFPECNGVTPKLTRHLDSDLRIAKGISESLHQYSKEVLSHLNSFIQDNDLNKLEQRPAELAGRKPDQVLELRTLARDGHVGNILQITQDDEGLISNIKLDNPRRFPRKLNFDYNVQGTATKYEADFTKPYKNLAADLRRADPEKVQRIYQNELLNARAFVTFCKSISEANWITGPEKDGMQTSLYATALEGTSLIRVRDTKNSRTQYWLRELTTKTNFINVEVSEANVEDPINGIKVVSISKDAAHGNHTQPRRYLKLESTDSQGLTTQVASGTQFSFYQMAENDPYRKNSEFVKSVAVS